MTVWHANADTRKAIGDEVEKAFAQTIACHCGGHFQFIGDAYPGCPDYTCDNCGQLVDVKSSPQAEQTGNLSVSVVPWGKYPDDLLLVTRIDGRWIGEYKRNIQPVSKDHAPTHCSTNTPFKNTRFHLIAWKDFKALARLGYKRR